MTKSVWKHKSKIKEKFMKKKIGIIVLVIIAILAVFVGIMFINMQKQMRNENPQYWEKDVSNIEGRYENTPDVDIVFVGSSSIRKWETLDSDFSEYSVVNHGFGGSKVADTTYYFNRLVTLFNPEAVVIFTGTNDINGVEGTSKTGDEVFELVKELYIKSQEELAGIPVYYISISPTKSRWKVWDDANRANQLIKEYAETQEFLIFIDTTDELMSDGKPNDDLFTGDGLHLNSEGYELWTSIIKPIVINNLN